MEDRNLIGILEHRETGVLAAALANPVGAPCLRDLVKPNETVAIVTSDVTRPCPSKLMLPLVLKELESAGVSQQNITIVFALGNHRPHREAEKISLVGEDLYRRFRCVDSVTEEMVYLGTTTRGTPVEVTRPVVAADRRILLGNVEYHYFAGYSGGLKAIMPGCASAKSIQANHSMMTQAYAHSGEIDRNPIRQDIEEVARFLPIDFIVNVVLDEHKDILAAFVGHPIRAHRAAARYLDNLYKIKISQQADIVIASAGGYPKDINLYQAQKAIDNAKRAVKPGGILILVAECIEGLGDETFTRWVMAAREPEDLIKRVHTHFELGGHKAAAIAMVRRMIDIFIVTSMPGTLACKIFLEPYQDLAQAYAEALKRKGPDAKVMIIPQAGSLLPEYSKNA